MNHLMQSEELINCLGYSIKSKRLKKLMMELGIDLNPKENLDTQGNNYNVNARNDSNEIILMFYGQNRYQWAYGEPKEVINSSKDELILIEITFNNNANLKEFKVPLPFNLKLGDSIENVIAKVGKRPSEKTKTNYGQAGDFKKDQYYFIIALDTHSQLLWMRVFKYGKSELEKIELRKELQGQRKNIQPDNETELQKFKDYLPTKAWKKRMKDGDDQFTESNIHEIEVILRAYIDKIVEYTKAKKASNIFNSVKKVVVKINKVNSKNDFFIETLEREELCEFIHQIIITTGFDLKNGIDLTEEWRDW